MSRTIGGKVKEAKADRIVAEIEPWLATSEEVTHIAKTSSVKPILDFIIVTNARALAISLADLKTKGPRHSLPADRIQAIEARKSALGFGHRQDKKPENLVVITTDGQETKFGQVLHEETASILSSINTLRDQGLPAGITASSFPLPQRAQDRSLLEGIEVIGQEVGDKALTALAQHCRTDEKPWMLISSGAFGTLAAFEDRLIVVKVGTLTSALAGSLGGGRVTVFPFSDITGIEYNAGLMNGVLEILTPSYAGGIEKDFWAKGANDPLKQSNTIPMVKPLYQLALPQLNELRKRISDHKRPPTSVLPTPAASSLTNELARLAELHHQGVLDDNEFKEAKAALIRAKI